MEKRKAIIISALRLFVVHGVHAVTMAQIAQEAGVGIGTVYRNFENKEEIVQQIWIWQKEEEAAFVFKDFKAEGTIHKQFNFLWGKVIKYFITHSLEFQFSYQFASSPILTTDIHEIAMKPFLAFDRLFEAGLKERFFKSLTARHLRLFTFSTINGWILWAIDENLKFTN